MRVVVVDVGALATFGRGSLRGGLGQSRRWREGENEMNKKETQLSCLVWRRVVGEPQRRPAILGASRARARLETWSARKLRLQPRP